MGFITDLSPIGVFLLLIVFGPLFGFWYYKRWTALFTTLAGYGIYAALLALTIWEGEKSGNWGAGTFLAIIALPYAIVTLIVGTIFQRNHKGKERR